MYHTSIGCSIIYEQQVCSICIEPSEKRANKGRGEEIVIIEVCLSTQSKVYVVIDPKEEDIILAKMNV